MCDRGSRDVWGTPTPGLQARGGTGGGAGGLLRFRVALRERAGTPYGRVSNCASLFQLPPSSSPCPPPVLPTILAQRPWTWSALRSPNSSKFRLRWVRLWAPRLWAMFPPPPWWRPSRSARLRGPLLHTARASPGPPASPGKALIRFRSRVSRREGSLRVFPHPFLRWGRGLGFPALGSLTCGV